MPLIFVLVDWIIRILMFVIVATALMSWFNPDPRNPIVKLLHGIVEPLLHPVRLIIPPIAGMDFSPLIVILILQFLQSLLHNRLAS